MCCTTLADRYFRELFHALLLIPFSLYHGMDVSPDVPWLILCVWNVKLLSETSYLLCSRNHLHQTCTVHIGRDMIQIRVTDRKRFVQLYSNKTTTSSCSLANSTKLQLLEERIHPESSSFCSSSVPESSCFCSSSVDLCLNVACHRSLVQFFCTCSPFLSTDYSSLTLG